MDPVLGGVCKAVRTIVTSLVENGIDNEVVSLDGINADFIVSDTFKTHALGKGRNAWGYNPKLLRWLKDNVQNYNVVVVHGLWLFSSYAVYLAIKSINKKDRPKYFVMPHGMLDPYFQKAKGRRLKAIRNWLYWKLIESKVVNSADGLLFTCEEECVLAKKSFKPYNPKKELIVGLGVEAPPQYTVLMDKAFFSTCDGLENKPFLLFLSRIHEKKGVDLLLEAYRKIITNPVEKKTPTYGSVFTIPALVIVGPGIETGYGKKLMRIIDEDSSLKKNIYLPGMLTGDAKWGAFYNSEAFILPSHQENFGIAVVESLACQKPVLISNQINIWKEIKRGEGGLVENDTLSGTIKLLQDWINLSPVEKEGMGRQSKICFETYFSIQALVSNWKSKVLNL